MKPQRHFIRVDLMLNRFFVFFFFAILRLGFIIRNKSLKLLLIFLNNFRFQSNDDVQKKFCFILFFIKYIYSKLLSLFFNIIYKFERQLRFIFQVLESPNRSRWSAQTPWCTDRLHHGQGNFIDSSITFWTYCHNFEAGSESILNKAFILLCTSQPSISVRSKLSS